MKKLIFVGAVSGVGKSATCQYIKDNNLLSDFAIYDIDDLENINDYNSDTYDLFYENAIGNAIIKSGDTPEQSRERLDSQIDNIIYGKPKDETDAYNMLKSLSGKCHKVLSGLCVIYNDYIFNDVCESKVSFKDLSDNDIFDYIKTKEPFGKAGSYAIQGLGYNLVSHYEGSLNNIIGLPTEMLKEVLDNIYEMEN